jgi:hypothetical protein
VPRHLAHSDGGGHFEFLKINVKSDGSKVPSHLAHSGKTDQEVPHAHSCPDALQSNDAQRALNTSTFT